ncbi:cytochrome P460 family protein [Paraliomyxa miuraensis]|uniref:cytochrome P460 family protein n=1 Tax=Paraliomyxa miuraensis TaxID=376150 RepID=UPI0022572648|nr:cytochrome P460 family protein [Paraliomyxa miuraensis]MCX4244023.1 cytochrome P460 family protein [Paraliomyxa miuraensis]
MLRPLVLGSTVVLALSGCPDAGEGDADTGSSTTDSTTGSSTGSSTSAEDTLGTTSVGTTSVDTTTTEADSSSGGEMIELADLPVGWEDWAIIGMTDRTDGGDASTIRLVVGNDTAVEAARSGDTSPWPEGSILVDVVWTDGGNGFSADMVAPDTFGAIAVMEKDSDRFAATGGWGYAIFRGDDLMPAEPDVIANPADDVDESTCYGCHNSRVPDQDFVFTMPLPLPTAMDIGAAEAHVNGMTLDEGLLEWRFISVHHRLANTQMRVVLGNQTAVDAARAGDTNPWPEGTVLADVVFAASAAGLEDWPDMIAPQSLAAIAVMERDAATFAMTGEWGYALWANGAGGLAPGGADGVADDDTTCFGCHNIFVGGANDFVFTSPGPLPSP